jgi:hypothetical protein
MGVMPTVMGEAESPGITKNKTKQNKKHIMCEEEARAHLFSRLGVVLQRGNGAIIANRIPHFPDSQTDGDQ